MLKIDGSYGEGGGQILRYAIALSVLTQTPVEITNIRAKRPNPGLRPQHYAAISCMQSLCNARVEGLSIGASTVTFTPKKLQPDTYSFDIGTAGSMTLVFQACILSSLKTTRPLTVQLLGGTDVPWSPSWDYFVHVFLPSIHKIGVRTDAKLVKRGYYPQGGGEATVTIHPVQDITPLYLEQRPTFTELQGTINSANLPDHIGIRMKHAAIKIAMKNNLQCSINIEKATSLSPGTGITLWVASDATILGSTVLGKRGVTAEHVSETAVNNLLTEMKSGATLDTFAIDQVLPYFVLAQGESMCLVRDLSNHAKTNIWLLKHFFNVDFTMVQQQELIQLSVRNTATIV